MKTKKADVPQRVKFVYWYNKIISFYILFLILFVLVSVVILDVLAEGMWILFVLLFLYGFWYLFMLAGIRLGKKSSYWVNVVVHAIIILIGLISLFNPSSDSLFGISASFINAEGVGVMAFNMIWALAFILFSALSIYNLFKKEVRDLF